MAKTTPKQQIKAISAHNDQPSISDLMARIEQLSGALDKQASDFAKRESMLQDRLALVTNQVAWSGFRMSDGTAFFEVPGRIVVKTIDGTIDLNNASYFRVSKNGSKVAPMSDENKVSCLSYLKALGIRIDDLDALKEQIATLPVVYPKGTTAPAVTSPVTSKLV